MRIVLPILVALASIAFIHAPADRVPQRPPVILTGPYSLEEEPARLRLTNRDDWVDVWTEHAGAPPSRSPHFPDVDFERFEVVAFFLGPSVNTSGVRDLALIEDDDVRRLRYREAGYQTLGPDGGAEHTMPFAFVIIPRRDVPLVLVENTQRLIVGDPVWEERETLAPARR